MRLIDADALIDKLLEWTNSYRPITSDFGFGIVDGFDRAIMHVRKAPTIEAEPVNRGRNLRRDYPSLFECSVCHWSDDDTTTGDTSVYNYCPHCGSKMDGGNNES